MRPNVDPELELRHALVAERDQARAERDRARDIAVALEGQVARAAAQADEWERAGGPSRIAFLVAADELRAALDPDPADRGTEEES